MEVTTRLPGGEGQGRRDGTRATARGAYRTPESLEGQRLSAAALL